MYPDSTVVTPRKRSNTASRHQKHPPPSTTVSRLDISLLDMPNRCYAGHAGFAARADASKPAPATGPGLLPFGRVFLTQRLDRLVRRLATFAARMSKPRRALPVGKVEDHV